MTGTPLRTIAVLTAGLITSTSIGLSVLTMQPLQSVPNQFFFGASSITGIQTSALEDEMAHLAKNTALSSIELSMAGDKFLLTPDDIGLRIDTKRTADRIVAKMPRSKADVLWDLWVPKDSTVVQPVLQADGALLEKSFKSIAEVLDIEPVDATISVINNKIVVSPDQSGRELDVKAAATELSRMIAEQNDEKLQFSMDAETFFIERPAKVLASDLEKFNVIANQIEMTFLTNQPDLPSAVERFHGFIPPESTITVSADQLQIDEIDTLDRLATVLYQVLLPIKGVEVSGRKAAAHVTAYAPAGLEAVVSAGEQMTFTNKTGQSLMLLANIDGDTLSIFVLADGPIVTLTLESITLQTIPPPVVESFTHELAPGVTNVLTAGKAGVVVSVRSKDDGRELYQDTYAAETRVVETGAKRATVPK